MIAIHKNISKSSEQPTFKAFYLPTVKKCSIKEYDSWFLSLSYGNFLWFLQHLGMFLWYILRLRYYFLNFVVWCCVLAWVFLRMSLGVPQARSCCLWVLSTLHHLQLFISCMGAELTCWENSCIGRGLSHQPEATCYNGGMLGF